jgi:hypothetical protein
MKSRAHRPLRWIRPWLRYMEGDTDVIIDVESTTVISKVLRQAKTTEMVNMLAANPILLGQLDARKTVSEVLQVNDFSPKRWMQGEGISDEQQEMKAEDENLVMSKGVMLDPTEGANARHTLVHLQYTKTVDFAHLPEGIKAIFMRHILGEHEANPQTGSVADAMSGVPPNPVGGPAAPGVQVQPADLTPSTVTGGEPNAASTNL